MIPSFSGQWPLLKLSPSCIISVTDHAPRYTADVEAEITRIWQPPARKPRLFSTAAFFPQTA
nr:hypothetical protein [Acetobacter persici]